MHYFLLFRRVPAMHNALRNFVNFCAELFMLKQDALRAIGDKVHDGVPDNVLHQGLAATILGA
jgi:hypothetical protein